MSCFCANTHTDGAGGGDACSTTGSGAILGCQIFGSPGIARRWPHTSRWYHCASHAVKKRTAHPYMRPLQLAVVKLTEILMLHFFSRYSARKRHLSGVPPPSGCVIFASQTDGAGDCSHFYVGHNRLHTSHYNSTYTHTSKAASSRCPALISCVVWSLAATPWSTASRFQRLTTFKGLRTLIVNPGKDLLSS